MTDRVDLDALDKLIKAAGEAQILYHKRQITLDDKLERQAAARVAIIDAYPAMAKELRELRLPLSRARKIVARSTTRRIDPENVAKALGAERVPSEEGRPVSCGLARRIP